MLLLGMVMTSFAGCGGSAKAAQSPNAAEGEVNTTLDSKYVSKDYMIAMKVNADCIVEEDKEAITIKTPSMKSLLVLKIYPGVQNLQASANNLAASIATNYTDGQAGQMTDGFMFGQRAKLVPFTCTSDGETFVGLSVATIANQSLYTLTVIFDGEVSESDLTLMQNVISGMVVLQPDVVDPATKKAAYKDPYPELDVYYGEYFDWYDIAAWEYLPYEYYAWWDGDYSAWDDAFYFEPDYNYYDDGSFYWSWGWDEEADWIFYDAYADYYDMAYYEALNSYYDDWDDEYDPWSDVTAEWEDPSYYAEDDEYYEEDNSDYYEEDDSDYYEEDYSEDYSEEY